MTRCIWDKMILKNAGPIVLIVFLILLSPVMSVSGAGYELSWSTIDGGGGTAGLKVSWQVTEVRHDPYAEDKRIEVEEDKAPEERGYYMYPEGYGYGQEKSLNSLRDSEAIEQLEEPESEVSDERS